jgi:septal ring factor EnvC (AmiA/AmiB activator)
MVRSQWKRFVFERKTAIGPSGRRRRLMKTNAGCEALDNRQLLSAAAAGHAVLSVPLATAVANAGETLNALNPSAFAQFQSELAKAESQSRVTSAQVRKLARDEKIIDQAIETYSRDANTTSTLLNQVQTDVDDAFLESALPASSWAQEQQGLSQLLEADIPNVHISTFLIRDMIDQAKAVARAAADTAQVNKAVAGDWAALSSGLSPTNASTASASLDPIEVYYEGQINNFIM